MKKNSPKLLPKYKFDIDNQTKLGFLIEHFCLFLDEKNVKTTNIRSISEKGLNKEYGDNFFSFIKNGWMKYFFRSEEPELVLKWFNICQTNNKIKQLSPKSATNRVFPNSPTKLIECLLPSITQTTQNVIAAAVERRPPIAIPRMNIDRPISRKASRIYNTSSNIENISKKKKPKTCYLL